MCWFYFSMIVQKWVVIQKLVKNRLPLGTLLLVCLACYEWGQISFCLFTSKCLWPLLTPLYYVKFLWAPFFACITQQKCQIISHIIKTKVVSTKNNRNFKNPSRIQRFSFILYQNRIRAASGYCALKKSHHSVYHLWNRGLNL